MILKSCENCGCIEKVPRYGKYLCSDCGYFYNNPHPSQAA